MRRLFLFAAVLVLAGCSDSPKPRRTNVLEAMPNIPLPPEASFLSREIGEDALKIRFRSVVDVDGVARYYRAVLGSDPWKLISDTPMQDGSIALYAEQKAGPPLWVTIRKAEGAPGSLVDLLGANTR
jgi:hypothetical protein